MQQTDLQLSREEQLWRANTYGLLASLLAGPPADATLALLTALDAGDTDPRETDIGKALQQLVARARSLDSDVVRDEFATLFIGVTRGEVVPYGSWYQSGFMMDKPLAELRSTLGQLGYERREGVYESEDHIAALCDLMRGLILDAEDDFKTALDKQRAVYRAHLSPWAGRFFNDLSLAEHGDFYRALAKLGGSFMALEDKYLKMQG